MCVGLMALKINVQQNIPLVVVALARNSVWRILCSVSPNVCADVGSIRVKHNASIIPQSRSGETTGCGSALRGPGGRESAARRGRFLAM